MFQDEGMKRESKVFHFKSSNPIFILAMPFIWKSTPFF